QAEDGIRDRNVTGVQTCALPIFAFETTIPSDLVGREQVAPLALALREGALGKRLLARGLGREADDRLALAPRRRDLREDVRRLEIGRASCRERVESAVERGALTR